MPSPSTVFLLFGSAWCGVQMLRGRIFRGAGELAVSVLIAALAVTVLAHPADLLLGENRLLGQIRNTAPALTAITVTHGESASTSPEQAAQPFNEALDTFAVQPHLALNHGLFLDRPHPCHQSSSAAARRSTSPTTANSPRHCSATTTATPTWPTSWAGSTPTPPSSPSPLLEAGQPGWSGRGRVGTAAGRQALRLGRHRPARL